MIGLAAAAACLLLLVVSFWGDRQRRFGLGAWSYLLSAGVYGSTWGVLSGDMPWATVWTVGPALWCVLGWVVLRRLVRLARLRRVHTLAALVVDRYALGPIQGAAVTALVLVTTVPLLAQEVRGLWLVLGDRSGSRGPVTTDPVIMTLIGLLFLFLISIRYTFRRLNWSRPQPGLSLVVSLLSTIKGVALVMLAALAVWLVWRTDGGQAGVVALVREGRGPGAELSYLSWAVQLALFGFAGFFLPQQFHVLAVQNRHESHIRPLMWALPLYLLLVHLATTLVPLTASAAGSAQGGGGSVIRASLPAAATVLASTALFCAAVAALVVSALTLARMTANHFLLPLWRLVRPAGPPMLGVRLSNGLALGGVLAAAVILGWRLERWPVLGSELVPLCLVGLVQLAPALVLGLFWPRSHRRGAVAGLLLGAALWLVTLVLPTLAWTGASAGPLSWWSQLQTSPAGVAPLDRISLGAFWSLAANLGLHLLLSMQATPDQRERRVARLYRHVLSPARFRRAARPRRGLSLESMRQLAALYTAADLGPDGLSLRQRLDNTAAYSLSEERLLQLQQELERELATVLGGPVAEAVVAHQAALGGQRRSEAEDVGRMAHLLGNMLPTLRRRLKKLQRQTALDDDSREVLEAAVAGIRRTLQTLGDGVSLVKGGPMVRVRHPSARELFGGIVGQLRETFNEMTIRFVPGKSDAPLWADAAALELALDRLLDCGRERILGRTSGRRARTVTLRLYLPADEDLLTLVYQDDGPELLPGERRELQHDIRPAICWQVVEGHRGTVAEASRPGHGLRFEISLPLCRPGQEDRP